ncbi:MAG: hypothetical protein WBG73_00895 [Coleofasciculaceae cyanobacterium]
MIIAKPFVPFAAIATVFAIPSIAAANTPDVAATTIPASACRPENDTTDSRVSLSNGAYVFNPGVTGTVRFYCPLPINGNRTNGINNNSMTRYNLYYRDSDGTGNAAQITSRLLYRSTGQFAIGSQLNSNTINTGTNLTSDRIHTILLNHTFLNFRLYYFLVTMTRTNSNLNPAFTGIDFVFPPIG